MSLNVFKLNNCYNWKNPLNWWRLPKHWCRMVKNACQRATKGYCDNDLWNLNDFYLGVLHDSLNEFAERRIGSPTEDYDVWTETYKKMAKYFYMANPNNKYFKNPYEDDYNNIFKNHKVDWVSNGDGCVDIEFVPKLTQEEIDLKRKYYEADGDVFEKFNAAMKAGFDMLKIYIWHLWD